MKNIRQKQQNDTRAQREERDAHSYNWIELVETCKLSSLVVSELDKYLVYHGLCKKGKKLDKMRRITVHYYTTSGKDVPEEQVLVNGKSSPGLLMKQADDDGSGSDDDFVLFQESDNGSESGSENGSGSSIETEDLEVPHRQTGRLTRHGRMAGHWTTRVDSGYVQ